MGSHFLPIMKESRLNLRISTRRLNKLRLYAVSEDKTITRIVEDWVDSLPTQKVEIPHTTNNPVDQEQH